MEFIQISVDVDALNKEKARITSRKFQSQGVEITKREMSFTIVPLKSEKIVKSYDTYDMVKVGFVSFKQTPEERQAKANTPIVGDAIVFRDHAEKAPSPTGDAELDTVTELDGFDL